DQSLAVLSSYWRLSMREIFILGVAATLASSPAFAQSVSSIGSSNAGHWHAPPRKGASEDLSKIQCYVFQTTGTRLGERKVCKTALEWKQMQSEHRETLEKVQQMGTGVPISG